jgi:hypothetical protein
MRHELSRRAFLVGSLGAGILARPMLLSAQENGSNLAHIPGLTGLGRKFSFAVIADPQVGHADDKNPVQTCASRSLRQAVSEINDIKPRPAFTVFLGDLVNVFDERSVTNFESCIQGLTAQPVLVHGNHDTHPPYTAFRQLAKRVSGFEDVFYSFNAGNWHFVVLPCNLGGPGPEQQDTAAAMLAWLESDLDANKKRLTMIFEHLHMLPQGLTQLEWYTFPLDLRLKLMDLFVKYGNVRFFFNGHVHNGIQTSLKTSWHYKGIDFITAPTIITPRNFGEEFAPYRRGLTEGGYYLLVDVDGKHVEVKGRLAGEKQTFAYPRRLHAFHEDLEPRWFRRTVEFPAKQGLTNGDFAHGLHGWQPCYRYVADNDPGFVWKACKKDGIHAAYVFTRAKEPLFWANDEMMELYQTVAMPAGGSPVLSARYFLEKEPADGGGYVRLNAMAGDAFTFMMMFKWGEHERKADILVRSFGYALTGTAQGWTFLQDLGRDRRGFFWNLPGAAGKWNRLTANVEELHDSALGTPGAFKQLNITKLFVAIGTWINRGKDAASGAYFADLRLSADAQSRSTINEARLPVDDAVFKTEFGQDLIERQRNKRK